MAEYVTHTLEPLYDGESRVLILGTMPSQKAAPLASTIPTRKIAFGACSPMYFSKLSPSLRKRK